MKQRIASYVVRTLAAGALAVTAAACATEVGPEQTGSGQEALPQHHEGNDTYLVCQASQWASMPFEQGLKALGCTGKVVADDDGAGHAIYQASCRKAATATFRCGPIVLSNDNWVTGDLQTLLTCFKDAVTPDHVLLSAGAGTWTSCGYGKSAAAGYAYVFWDPTCTGGGCVDKLLVF